MKPLDHHARKLAQRFLQAETTTDPDEASRIIRKAEKHQRKINKIHRLIQPLINAFRKEVDKTNGTMGGEE